MISLGCMLTTNRDHAFRSLMVFVPPRWIEMMRRKVRINVIVNRTAEANLRARLRPHRSGWSSNQRGSPRNRQSDARLPWTAGQNSGPGQPDPDPGGSLRSLVLPSLPMTQVRALSAHRTKINSSDPPLTAVCTHRYQILNYDLPLCPRIRRRSGGDRRDWSAGLCRGPAPASGRMEGTCAHQRSVQRRSSCPR